MDFEEVVKPLLEKIEGLEQKIAESEKKLEVVCGMNKALISNKQVSQSEEPTKNRVREYIEGGR